AENRFGSTAEPDRLVGCISAKAAVQQNATKQRSSVRALLITPFFCSKAIKCPLTTCGLHYGTRCMVNVALRPGPLRLAPMPLWVIGRYRRAPAACLLYPRKQTFSPTPLECPLSARSGHPPAGVSLSVNALAR